MPDSQNSQTGKPESGGVPSPPLPKISSPSIPDIKSSPDKPKATEEKPSPAASFHLADPEAEAKLKANAQQAAAQNTAQKGTDSSAQSQPTTQAAGPKPFSRAAVPGPRNTPTPQKIVPNLAPHEPASKPSPALIRTPKLDKALENLYLSKEEKGELDKASAATGWEKFLEFLQPITLWLVRVSILFAVVSAGFLILNFLHGNLSPNSPLANSGELLHYISLASLTLEVSAVALACCLMLLQFDATAVAFSILAIGLLLHFGTPLLLFNQIGRTTATGIITLPLQQAGLVLVALGMLKYIVDILFWIRTLPERMQARADLGATKPEEAISQIIQGESLNVIKSPTHLGDKGKPSRGLLYTYLGDQAHKFRLFSFLAVPTTGLIVFLLWPLYTKAFMGFSHYLDRFWDLLSFNPHNLATGVLKSTPEDYNHLSTLSPDQVAHVALVIFGALLGFTLLIYILKFIEWAVYTAKW